MARVRAALLVDLRKGTGRRDERRRHDSVRPGYVPYPILAHRPNRHSFTALPSNTSRLVAGDAAWCVVRGRRLKEGGSEPGYQREGTDQ